MTEKNKKQFGVWMDSQHATITGRKSIDTGDFVILGHVKNASGDSSSNENKFFKDIASIMVNIDEVHVTGTGQVQEQFIKYLASTPQYKNTVSSESTSKKMGETQLISFITKHFN